MNLGFFLSLPSSFFSLYGGVLSLFLQMPHLKVLSEHPTWVEQTPVVMYLILCLKHYRRFYLLMKVHRVFYFSAPIIFLFKRENDYKNRMECAFL